MKDIVPISTRSLDFALMIVSLYNNLQYNKEFVISRQLLKAGTSIGANVAEATAAQTKADFIAKMAIASKEARETKYWLLLLQKSNLVSLNYSPYLTEIDNIINILTRIVKSAKENSARL